MEDIIDKGWNREGTPYTSPTPFINTEGWNREGTPYTIKKFIIIFTPPLHPKKALTSPLHPESATAPFTNHSATPANRGTHTTFPPQRRDRTLHKPYHYSRKNLGQSTAHICRRCAHTKKEHAR